LTGCGWLPADTPVEKPAPVDPDVALFVHAWKIGGHVLAVSTSMSDADATALHGRTIRVGTNTYSSPWHGTCEAAGRQRRKTTLSQLTDELDINARARKRLRELGLTDPLFEFKFYCADGGQTPSLTMFVGDERALTCWNGVCYVLAR
jgi:hypothetical protein